MRYPAYRILNKDGESRSFFWFCFARLGQISNNQGEFSNFLTSANHQQDGRRPYWDFVNHENIDSAKEVVRIEAALHVNDWSDGEITEIMGHKIFADFEWNIDYKPGLGKFVVVGINTEDKYINEIMFPLFMFRNIFSCRDSVMHFWEKAGFSFIESAFLGTAFAIAKGYDGIHSVEWISDDYRLAVTMEALAFACYGKIGLNHGGKWGAWDCGYREGNFCSLADDSMNFEGQDIEDVMDHVHCIKASEGIVYVLDKYKQALETVREKT